MSELKDFLKKNRLPEKQIYMAKGHIIHEIKDAFKANEFSDFIYKGYDNPHLSPEEKAVFPENPKGYCILIAPFTKESMDRIYTMSHNDVATRKLKIERQDNISGYDPINDVLLGKLVTAMNKDNPIWLNNKIQKDTDFLEKHGCIKMTAGKTHEDQRHANKTISDLIDRALNSAKDHSFQPVSAFFSPEKRDDTIYDAIMYNMEDITPWSCQYGDNAEKDTLTVFSDVKIEPVGFGILWNKDRSQIRYMETHQTAVPLYRDPSDANEIYFKRRTAYPSFLKETFQEKGIMPKSNFDLLPYMKQTRHYQKALATNDAKTIKWLEFLVQQPNPKQSSRQVSSEKPCGPRHTPKRPELRAASDDHDDRSL